MGRSKTNVEKLPIGVKLRKVDAAEILGVSRQTITNLIKEGVLKFENRRVFREV